MHICIYHIHTYTCMFSHRRMFRQGVSQARTLMIFCAAFAIVIVIVSINIISINYISLSLSLLCVYIYIYILYIYIYVYKVIGGGFLHSFCANSSSP